jgi:hypothetical protein
VQIDLGQLTQHKDASAKVQQLGLEQVRRQQAALDRLQAVGVDQDFWVDTELQDPEVQLYKQLDSLNGQCFDEGYVRQLGATSAELTRLLGDEVRSGHDRALRAYAADELRRMGAVA